VTSNLFNAESFIYNTQYRHYSPSVNRRLGDKSSIGDRRFGDRLGCLGDNS